MAYGLPSVAEAAQPYINQFNDMQNNVYGFKNTVRRDFLADQQVPLALMKNQADYLDQAYKRDSNASTYGIRLNTNMNDAKYEDAVSGIDLSEGPDARRQRYELGESNNEIALFDNRTSMEKKRDDLLQVQSEKEYEAVLRRSQGTSPLDQVENALQMVESKSPNDDRLNQIAQNRLLEVAIEYANTMPIGSAAHEKSKQILRRFGMYGTPSVLPNTMPVNGGGDGAVVGNGAVEEWEP